MSVGITVKPGIKDLLITAAEDQFRSVAQQISKYIVDGLIRDGYIKPPAAKTLEEVMKEST